MHGIDQIIVALFLVLCLGVGLFKKNKQGQTSGVEYILGGRQLTLPAFVATTVSTWYGGILGVGEYTFRYGVSNWVVFGVPYYVGALLFALLLSKRARSGETLTLPEMLGKAFGKSVKWCASILILLTTLPAAYLLIFGVLCEFSFGMSSNLGIILGAIFVVAYVWRSGFRAVVRTDSLQMGLMFGSFLLLSLLLLFGQGLEPILALDSRFWRWDGGLPIGSVIVWYFIALSTLVEPSFFQRCYAAKSPKIARRGLMISVFCWLVFDFMTTFCGLYARALLSDLENPLFSFPTLAARILPTGLLGIFIAGLFATVLSTLDSYLFVVGTTVGRDLELGGKRSLVWKTRAGLIFGGFAAALLALLSESVVSLWHLLGTLSGATLLLPTLMAYYPILRIDRPYVLIMVFTSLAVTVGWIAWKMIQDAYPWAIEPMFVGIGVALIVFLFGKLMGQTNKTQTSKELLS